MSYDFPVYDLDNPLDFPSLRKPNSKQRRKTHNDNGNSQSRIDNLDDALLELIFTRLFSYRHLAASKCVSRRWKSIISNPDFIRHLSLAHSPFTLLLRGANYPYGTFYEKYARACVITEHPYFLRHQFRLGFIPGNLHSNQIDIVAHHDDLLVTYRVIDGQKAAYCIANPLTKKFIDVPITSDPAKHDYESVYYFYRWCNKMVGFTGFVDGVSTLNATNSYENSRGFQIVVIMSNEYRHDEYILQIYISQSGLWKTYPFNYIGFPIIKQALTWHNKVHALHWDMRPKILVIDPFDDDFVSPCLLNLPNEINMYSVLGVSRDRLRIAQFETTRVSSDKPRIKVWEIEDYYDNVIELKLVIDFELNASIVERVLSPIVRLFPCRKTRDGVICCHPNDPDVIYFNHRDTLFYCNVVNKKLKAVSYLYCQNQWPEIFVFRHPLMTG